MDNYQPSYSSSSKGSSDKSILDSFPSKTAFIMGFIGAILVLGTLGFIILGSQMLKEDDGSKTADAPIPTAAAEAPTAPTAPTAAPPAGDPPEVTDKDNVTGKDDAKITMIVYTDFECPFCSRFHPTVKQVIDEYGDDVRVVFRHFPLSFHNNAESAAEASECAAEQDKFWEYADKLFENNTALGEETYLKLAEELGLNKSKFQECLDSDKYLEEIRTQMREGSVAGVTGTPGSFVIDADGNSQIIKGALPFASVQSTIDSALE